MDFLKKVGLMVLINLFGWFLAIAFPWMILSESGFLEKKQEALFAEERYSVRFGTLFRGEYKVEGSTSIDAYAFYCSAFAINNESSSKGSIEERVLRCPTLEVLTLKDIKNFRLPVTGVSTSPTVVLSSKEGFTLTYTPDVWGWDAWLALVCWGLFVIIACVALNWFFALAIF